MGKPEVPIDRDELIRVYKEERRTLTEVASFFNTTASTIHRRLKREGVEVRNISSAKKGKSLSAEHRSKVIKTLRNGLTGEQNPAWKGGKSWKGRHKDDAYVIILVDGKYVPEHRYVAEQHMGRKLHPKEHVHHIDGNKRNNSLNNLLVLSARDHVKLHMTPEHRAHLSTRSSEARHARFWSTRKRDV